MSRKEVPRAGLVKAALAGRITNQQGATALHLSVRQFLGTHLSRGAALSVWVKIALRWAVALGPADPLPLTPGVDS